MLPRKNFSIYNSGENLSIEDFSNIFPTYTIRDETRETSKAIKYFFGKRKNRKKVTNYKMKDKRKLININK